MIDLIDHGIMDIDIMTGKMMGEYVAMLMIRSNRKVPGMNVITTFSFHDKEMKGIKMLVGNAIMAVALKNNPKVSDGNTAIQ